MFSVAVRHEYSHNKPSFRHLALLCLGTACMTAAAGFAAFKVMEPSEHELRLRAIADQEYTADPARNDLKERAMYAVSKKHTPTEEKLTAVFRKVGDTVIQVQCAPIPEWKQKESDALIQAYVDLDTGLTKVAPEHCEGASLVIDKQEPFASDKELDKAALGVHTLTHENEHLLHPDDSEAVVDCYAIQETAKAAKQLGASAKVADQIGRRIAEIRPPRQPKDYASPVTCHDGGALDLSLSSEGYFPKPEVINTTK